MCVCVCVCACVCVRVPMGACQGGFTAQLIAAKLSYVSRTTSPSWSGVLGRDRVMSSLSGTGRLKGGFGLVLELWR